MFRETSIPGCLEIELPVSRDKRGSFTKSFRRDWWHQAGLKTEFLEEYHTLSGRGVLRGLHFQLPPRAVAKLVYCPWGEVLDAVVDLRSGSPAYGRHQLFDLKDTALYLPRGLAHGFYVLSDSALMVYKVSDYYAPELDAGILWDSAGIPWPDEKPLISNRDAGFPDLKDFKTPFRFEG